MHAAHCSCTPARWTKRRARSDTDGVSTTHNPSTAKPNHTKPLHHHRWIWKAGYEPGTCLVRESAIG